MPDAEDPRMPDPSDKTSCHELHVLATNGRVFLLRVVDVDRLFLSRTYVLSLAVYCVVLALVDPQVFGQQAALPYRILFWASNGLSLTIFIAILFRLVARVYAWRGWSGWFPMAVILLVGTELTQLLNELVAVQVFDLHDVWVNGRLGELLRYGLVVIAFELMLATVIFPREFRELSRKNEARAAARKGGDVQEPDGDRPNRGAEPAQDETGFGVDVATSARRALSAGGQNFALSDLLYLKSVEHYVEIVMRDGSEMIRAALKDLTEQMSEADGVQTHRSFWVAREAVVGMTRQGGNAFVLLTNGNEIPVSRQRRAEVSDWIERFRD